MNRTALLVPQFAPFLLAVSVIALTGSFFSVLGSRQFRSRRFGLARRSLLREAGLEILGKRQASGRGTGLYFALFGLFLRLFCVFFSGMLLFTRNLMPDREDQGTSLPSTGESGEKP